MFISDIFLSGSQTEASQQGSVPTFPLASCENQSIRTPSIEPLSVNTMANVMFTPTSAIRVAHDARADVTLTNVGAVVRTSMDDLEAIPNV